MTSDRANDGLTVIGMDFATQPRKVGIAHGDWTGDECRVKRAWLGKSWGEIVEQVAALIESSRAARTLLALDAPLGWPKALGEALPEHRAGAVLRFDADKMFHRQTDEVVKRHLKLKQNPMEVGADKIARTAHAALTFLDCLREHTGLKVKLAWKPGCVDGIVAIEVYPAATLAGRCLPNQGYKKAKGRRMRCDLVRQLADILDIEQVCRELDPNDDLLDAALCVVAGADFAASNVVRPSEEETEQAMREGWIWFKPLE